MVCRRRSARYFTCQAPPVAHGFHRHGPPTPDRPPNQRRTGNAVTSKILGSGFSAGAWPCEQPTSMTAFRSFHQACKDYHPTLGMGQYADPYRRGIRTGSGLLTRCEVGDVLVVLAGPVLGGAGEWKPSAGMPRSTAVQRRVASAPGRPDVTGHRPLTAGPFPPAPAGSGTASRSRLPQPDKRVVSWLDQPSATPEHVPSRQPR